MLRSLKREYGFSVLSPRAALSLQNFSVESMDFAVLWTNKSGVETLTACDDEIIPLQDRIETVGDETDLQEVYETERHLLYVACTRARDHLLVTSTEPASEFLDDLRVR
jgi:ATP-dependent exoDNAse (exonuclease V) beta subunit